MNFTEYLNQIPSFSDFTQDEIHLLAQAMATKEYSEGHVFVKEGKTSDGLYLIIDGEVVVSRERKDHGIDIMERLVSGELFGLVSLIDHGVRSATCTAAKKVTAAYLPRAAFQMLYQAHTCLGYHFQHMIARQLAHDIRIYTDALMHGIAHKNKYHTYEAIKSTRKYKGPERRTESRRTDDRRDKYSPRIVQE
jgi:CRP-like cAMP-binding protein